MASPSQFLSAFAVALVDPINSLWFVHMLAIFYIVTRLLRAGSLGARSLGAGTCRRGRRDAG